MASSLLTCLLWPTHFPFRDGESLLKTLILDSPQKSGSSSNFGSPCTVTVPAGWTEGHVCTRAVHPHQSLFLHTWSSPLSDITCLAHILHLQLLVPLEVCAECYSGLEEGLFGQTEQR